MRIAAIDGYRTRSARAPRGAERRPARGTFMRKLREHERGLLAGHLLRLDADDRTRRFLGVVRDEHVRDYCARDAHERLVVGLLVDGVLRGAAELILNVPAEGHGGSEVALSLEKRWQNRGIGYALLERALLLARNRGAAPVRLHCLRENRRMQAIARKAGAEFVFAGAEVTGRIPLPWPNGLSLLAEFWSDGQAVFNVTCDDLLRHVARDQPTD